MLIGGFQNIDLEKVQKSSQKQSLKLPCDLHQQYTRQIFTNNGRTATIYMLEHCMKLGKGDIVLLPDYLCLSIIVSIEDPGVEYRFYRINEDLSIDMDDLKSKIDEDVKGIYIIHYFGVPLDESIVDELKNIRSKYDIPIIEDITQTLLSKDDKRMGFGEYLVASTRKWLPMTDGGLLAARDNVVLPILPLEDAYNVAAYKQLLTLNLRDYYNRKPEKDIWNYLAWEKEANKARYDDLSVRDMTEFSRNIMFGSDLEAISIKRRKNYKYLYNRLQGNTNIKIASKPLDNKGNYVPFGLVLLVKERDLFYQYMVNKGIIGEIQWELPLDYYKPGKDALYLSEHNLMIHCDQRYTEEQMSYVADCILSFFKK